MSAVMRACNECRDFTLRQVETDEVKKMREGLKVSMHTGKMIACAALVILVAVTFFSVLFCFWAGGNFLSYLALFPITIGSALSVVTYDAMIATEEGYQLCNKAENFWVFNHPALVGQAAVIKHCRHLVDQMLKDTYVLKYAHQFVFDRYWVALSNQLTLSKIKKNERDRAQFLRGT